MRTIRKHRVLLCRSPLLRVVEFIRRGRHPDQRPSRNDVRFRCLHTVTRTSSPGSNKGNGEEEKFIAPWKKRRKMRKSSSDRNDPFRREWKRSGSGKKCGGYRMQMNGRFFRSNRMASSSWCSGSRGSEIEREEKPEYRARWVASPPYVFRDWKKRKKEMKRIQIDNVSIRLSRSAAKLIAVQYQ